MTVRVRIAPAPSGSLHVGNVRTALFNWLFARHNKGTFILRVEDTDPHRVQQEHYQTIEDDLLWMGLNWDEGPIRQSDRLEIYREAAEKLIDAGAAFRCYCTPEELAAKREEARAQGRPTRYDGRCLVDPPGGDRWVVRLRVPAEGETNFEDVVTGPVTFHHDQLDHVVLIRSDGTPLYIIAAAVDDGMMNISHVIRGIDLQSSTPYQIMIQRGLGYEVPQFAHLPLINDVSGKPLSKRKESSSLLWYRESGFIAEAMVNYLAIQGWGSGDESLFTLDELVEKFELHRVHASPATFDLARLEWMNGEHIRMLDDTDFIGRVGPFLAAPGLIETPPTPEQEKRLKAIAPELKTRIRRLDGAPGLVRGIFSENVELDPETVDKFLRDDQTRQLLEKAVEELARVERWDVGSIDAALHKVVEESGLKPKKAYVPFYVAIHGSRVGAPLFNSMELIGREKTLERLQKALSLAA